MKYRNIILINFKILCLFIGAGLSLFLFAQSKKSKNRFYGLWINCKLNQAIRDKVDDDSMFKIMPRTILINSLNTIIIEKRFEQSFKKDVLNIKRDTIYLKSDKLFFKHDTLVMRSKYQMDISFVRFLNK